MALEGEASDGVALDAEVADGEALFAEAAGGVALDGEVGWSGPGVGSLMAIPPSNGSRRPGDV
ncbi:hypothetical protein [Streptantibioticus silvisoli]|uniref:Uncharacterized protein n=1 Tax=Streptantibioticus silvisoli TaxID=2705255 RepID=A0ABT6WAD5_9ACTN|nr:hypothetical protein [Streptantibioticus silvisoli]MDI5966891.1 hypothetical protein [Streptantibioticus silvisoli]